MLNIKWLNPSYSLQPSKGNIHATVENHPVHINPGYYILRSYYKYKSPDNYKKLNWLDPHFAPLFTDDVEKILDQDIDILCLSFFMWNLSSLSSLAKRLKRKNPNIIIIAGGPQLDAHKRSNFFEDHPYIDYVVYGDGEEPFASILDSIIGNSELSESSVNLITKYRKYPFKVFSDKTFWASSYVLDMKEEISKDVLNLYEKYKDIKLDWEMDRGCPYSCSFCDWSSGLHHKVKRRSKYWKEEMEFQRNLPVLLKFGNANFGLFEEDLEIAQYIVDHKIKNIKIPYFAKLNKNRTWKIQDLLASYNDDYTIRIALQDIDEEILENIDRPTLSWEEEREYIIDFNKKYPNHMVYFEIMIGLPGQTVETFKYLTQQIHKLGIKNIIMGAYHWHLLYNTPAYNSEYQKKYKMVFEDYYIPTMESKFLENVTLEELDELYEEGSPLITKFTWVKETYSADWLEMIKMDIIMAIYGGLRSTTLQVDPGKIFFNPSFDRFLDEEAKSIMASAKENRIWGKWCPDDKAWFSIDNYYYRPIFVKKFLGRFYK